MEAILSELKLYGGPMDGGRVDRSFMRGDTLTRGITGEIHGIIIPPKDKSLGIDSRVYCWAWDDTGGAEQRVKYKQDSQNASHLNWAGYAV